MTKKTPGYWVLNVVSILLALIFIAPIFWALMVSFQREGKPITSVVDWFYAALYAGELSENHHEFQRTHLADQQSDYRGDRYCSDGNLLRHGGLRAGKAEI